MKKNHSTLLLVAILFMACKPEKSGQPFADVGLSASKATVSKNEPVIISVQNMPAGSVYTRWSVSPATGVILSDVFSGTGQGQLTFSHAGEYQVFADLRTVHPNCRPSPGYDTCYANRSSMAKPTINIIVKD